MKSIISIILILFSISSWAQSSFLRYFDEASLPVHNLEKYLDVKFEWNMKGDIQAYLNEGLNYLDEGNFDLAASRFSKVIEMDPTLWVSFYYRGISYRKLKQYSKAENDLQKAKSLRPKQAEITVELGEVYQVQGKLSTAAELYKDAISINPKLVNSYFNLGLIELRLGNSSKAIRQFEKCLEVDPEFPDAYMVLGILKFREKKKNTESILLYDQALKADSTYTQTYFWRGLAYIDSDQNEKCLTDWSRFILFNPGNSFVLMMRGFLFIEMNRFDEAFTDLRKAFLSRHLDEEEFSGAHTLLDSQIDLQGATHYLIRTGYGLKEESFAFLKKGYCLLLANRKTEALENIKKAERVESSATVYFLEAIAWEQLSNHDSAFQYYDKALHLDKDLFDAYKKRAIYFSELNNWKAAYADFNEMIRLQPESLNTYRLRGFAKGHLGDYYGAILDLTKFLKSDSTDFASFKGRAFYRAKVGDLKGANEDLRKVLSFDPDSWQITEEVGKNYLMFKDTAEAIEVYQAYAAREKKLPPMLHKTSIVHFELARIYVDQKKWSRVAEELRILKPLSEKTIYHTIEKSQVLLLEGLVSYYHSAFDEAIARFSEALMKNRENDEAKYFRAKAYNKIGAKKRCLRDLKDLKELNFRDAGELYETLSVDSDR